MPSALAGVGSSALQAVTVIAPSYGARTATLTAWSRKTAGSPWKRTFGPELAHVGYNGVAPAGAKREGDGRTPSGVYSFSYAFGIQPDPGVNYRWRAVRGPQDVWDDDPASARYNQWVDTRTADPGRSPEPMNQAPAYNEGLVIAYNTARTPGRGSAIFFHVATGGSTAGCVSVPASELTPILRWLRPTLGAVISIGVG
ncbi:MAG: hypothetical protein JWM02_3143 [Frankiales bacterium]|nr:hypothetical protein [Frankiales bacterium]